MIYGVTAKDLSLSVIILIAILMILTGAIIPRWVYKQKDIESERWRAAYETEREARATSDAQTSRLLEGQNAMTKLMTAIFENSEKMLKKNGGRREDSDMAS